MAKITSKRKNLSRKKLYFLVYLDHAETTVTHVKEN